MKVIQTDAMKASPLQHLMPFLDSKPCRRNFWVYKQVSYQIFANVNKCLNDEVWSPSEVQEIENLWQESSGVTVTSLEESGSEQSCSQEGCVMWPVTSPTIHTSGLQTLLIWMSSHYIHLLLHFCWVSSSLDCISIDKYFPYLPNDILNVVNTDCSRVTL